MQFSVGVVYIPINKSRGIDEQVGVFTNVRIRSDRAGDVVYCGEHEFDADRVQSRTTDDSYVAIGDSDIIITAANNEGQAWNLLRRELIKDGLDAEVPTFIDAVRGKPVDMLHNI